MTRRNIHGRGPRCAFGARPAGAARNRGYALLVILLALSVFTLVLAEAIPAWTVQIRREHENQMIDRAREYRTAIRRYFHKNGRYPPSLDILLQEDGSGVRYLREAWPDPLAPAGSADSDSAADFHGWQVIHYGQAVPAEIVDQPPAAATSGGLSGIAGPALSASSPARAGVGASDVGLPGQGSGSAATSNLPGMGSSTQGSGGPGGPGQPGAAISGAPVIGVASSSKEPAVHAFNGSNIPNDWEFVYNYAQDPTLRVAAAPGAGQGSSPAAPGAAGGGGPAPSASGVPPGR